MMNKLKNILHSWDEADTYLKEKIEKSENEVLNKTVPQEQFVTENEIAYPYTYNKTALEGYNPNEEDGWFTLSGTGTSSSIGYITYIYRVDFLEKDETYTLSLDVQGESSSTISTYCTERVNGGSGKDIIKSTELKMNEINIITFKATQEDGHDGYSFIIKIPSKSTVNFKFRPMIEKGTTAHNYQPYKYSRKSLEERITVLENALIEMASLMEE